MSLVKAETPRSNRRRTRSRDERARGNPRIRARLDLTWVPIGALAAKIVARFAAEQARAAADEKRCDAP
jgi:hypothetical protein